VPSHCLETFLNIAPMILKRSLRLTVSKKMADLNPLDVCLLNSRLGRRGLRLYVRHRYEPSDAAHVYCVCVRVMHAVLEHAAFGSGVDEARCACMLLKVNVRPSMNFRDVLDSPVFYIRKHDRLFPSSPEWSECISTDHSPRHIGAAESVVVHNGTGKTANT
jgi:hypothetical protein